MNVHQALDTLKARLYEIHDLHVAAGVLQWDQETYMPPKGAKARARQVATLRRLAHEKFTSPEIGEMLQILEDQGLPQWDPDSDEARLVRVTRYDYDRATKVPSDWVKAFAQLTSEARVVWREARARADFALFRPYLERIVAMVREYAHFFAPFDHIYDPLLDRFERKMKTAQVQALFERVREGQTRLLQHILRRPQVDNAVLHRHYDRQKQRDLIERMVAHIGFDLERGRIDFSTHPFTTGFSIDDVRFTIRIKENDLSEVLSGGLHEMGHALYHQGIDPKYEGLPLGRGASLGVHESQSRLWENLVGRSRAFWQFFFPWVQETFPENLRDVTPEAFYRALNRVEPSFIRVEADEVTYNLHIILRFELEIALLTEDLKVADLPEAWNAKMKAYLGVVPPDDAKGVLQDIHWSQGSFGYFPTYALGNLLSAQIWNAMAQELGDLNAFMSRGEFQPILEWLRERIYRHGNKFDPQELIQRATGQTIQAEPYLAYLEGKYGDIYG